MSARGPSLGFQAPNFMENPNLVSVRSGRPGLVHYPLFPVLGCNSRFRCTTVNLIADLESTQNFGSYRVSPGQNRNFYTELPAPTQITRTGNYGSDPVARRRNIIFDPENPYMTRIFA